MTFDEWWTREQKTLLVDTADAELSAAIVWLAERVARAAWNASLAVVLDVLSPRLEKTRSR